MGQQIAIHHGKNSYNLWWENFFLWQRNANHYFSAFLPGRTRFAEKEIFKTMQDELQRSFAEIFNTRQMFMPLLTGNHTEPYIDILETPNGFIIRCDVPGVDAKTLDINTLSSGLLISGKRKECEKPNKVHTLHSECCHGTFERAVALPNIADLNEAEASFDLNVLTIRVPKKAKIEANDSSNHRLKAQISDYRVNVERL